MRLSAELFEQIVAALKSDGQKDRDKRLEPRVGMAGEATIVFLAENGKKTATKVRIRDLSYGGIGLVHTKKFPDNHRFIIQLPSISGEPIWLACNSAHCRKTEPDRFSIGARISQVLRYDQIFALENKPMGIETLLKEFSSPPPPVAKKGTSKPIAA